MYSIEALVRQKVRVMKVVEVILRAIRKEITWIQAAEICRYSDRHMRRLRWRWEKKGYDGLMDRRSGRPRRKKIPIEVVRRVMELRREKYFDFNVAHFYEVITGRYGIKMSYTYLKDLLQSSGLAERGTLRGKHRIRRERRAMRGMMLHMDGSSHNWLLLSPLEEKDLVVVADDADGKILFGDFYEEEGTQSTFEALYHVISRNGLFGELYTDRGSHMCYTRKASEGPDLSVDTQVQSALRTLRINLILGNSPQARGRSERVFETIQGRLPQELRAAGIKTWEAARHYLKTQFIPSFNKRFSVEPRDTKSAFISYVGNDLKEVLSQHYERIVTNDNCVSFEGVTLQIPQSEFRNHFVKCRVQIHRYTDSSMTIFYGQHCLGRYTSNGQLITKKLQKKAVSNE